MTAATETRPGPAGSVTDEETGKRFYIIDDDKFWSVSTATGVIDKDALKGWAASLAARFAFEELPTIVTAARTRPCGRTYYRCKHDWRDAHTSDCACKICETCVRKWLTDRHLAESSRRADEGKRTHDVVEWWALDGEWIPYKPDIAPYVEAFKAFIAEYGLTPDSFLVTECVVINRAHKYAGTTDGIIRFHARATQAAAELVARALTRLAGEGGEKITAEMAIERDLYVDLVVDFKTQDKPADKEKWYPEQALQLGGYRWASVIRIKNTEIERAMPDTHGAALIHLRPDGCTVRLTVADEGTFEAFLWALNLYRWLHELGTASVSVRSFPLPKAPAKRAATARKAAPRKATKAKAGPGTGPNGCAAISMGDAGQVVYCLGPGPGGPHPAGKHWFPGEPEPVATPPGTARLATRTTATRLGVDADHPAPVGSRLTDDDIPF